MRPVLLVALLSLCGCSSLESWEALQHEITVLETDLPRAPSLEATTKHRVDLEVFGYAGHDRLMLKAIVEAMEKHPGLDLNRIRYQGEEAATGRRRAGPVPSAVSIQLAMSHVASGTWTNSLIAFPGMIAFAPCWLGYSWTLRATLTGLLILNGEEPQPPFQRTVTIDFREQNCRLSALFHLWPSTGVFGTQFVLGVFMAPRMAFYHRQDTTGPLLEHLGPRFGDTFAAEIYRRVRACDSRGVAGALRDQ